MRADHDRCRCAMPADMFEHPAICGVTESPAAVFYRHGHAHNAKASQAIDHAARNTLFNIDAIGVAVPGLVRRDGTVWAPNLPDWENIPLAKAKGSLPSVQKARRRLAA